ncbi:RES family NAD+ phosphorylase [Streptomyces sp. NPDC047072]|uniref:RES family NAD+ phosphorylase n=1 Tax=Streptomyces sp. NPDC047072 TaxID=3154809 RepID=UPI0033DB20F8
MGSADGDDGAEPCDPEADVRALCLRHVRDEFLAEELQLVAFEGECAFCAHGASGPVRVVRVDGLTTTLLSALSGHGSPKAPPDPAQAITEHCGAALDAEVLRAVLDHVDRRQWSGEPVEFVPRTCPLQDNWEWLCRTTVDRDLDLSDGDLSPRSDRHRLEALMGRIADIVRAERIVRIVEPGRKIWRGRMRSDATLPGYRAPDIGAVPAERAAENRMSRAGVPLFYGSADSGTAVVEISARDGRPFAAVAAFETIRELRVLDLVDIPELPSPFDRKQAARRDALVFLHEFAQDLSKPVFYDGRRHRDYRPTQYVTDCLRASAELDVQGIRFRSAHNGGVNYALFVDAGRSTLRLIEGSERVEPRSGGHPRSAETQAV